MESIVDDILAGRVCECCGFSFKHPDIPGLGYEHGGPVACQDCWESLSTSDKKEHQRATVETFG